MSEPRDILIGGERHAILHNQFVNLQAKIDQLERMIGDADREALLPYLGELQAEFSIIKEAYPAIDGSVSAGTYRPEEGWTKPPPWQAAQRKKDTKIRSALEDLRLLIDAAHLAYITEGQVACHFKAMLDYAWGNAAEEVGISTIDDMPF